MTKFLLDRMLGQTAKWLRLLGIDAEYPEDIDDEELLKKAEEENRVLITRDRELARNEGVMLVEKAPAEDTVVRILESYDVKIEPMTRCSKCNGEVEEIEKKDVEKKVPEGVFQRHDTFWICKECDQIYWEGTHWDSIMETVEKIKKRIG